MLKWALVFFLVAIVAGFFGFTGVAAGAATVARGMFFLFLVAAIGVAVAAMISGRTAW